MNLIIDVGNTVAKLAVFQKDELLVKRVSRKEEINQEIKKISAEYPLFEKVVISNVTQTPVSLPLDLEKKAKVLVLSPGTKLPFQNLYATPQTLGNDRKAVVAAAAKQFPNQNVLVIDAGSCITYDFKNFKNEYLGGAISPGLKMRFKALHTFTANLPLIEPEKEVNYLGNSTLGSINSGVAFGMLKEIEGMIDAYTEKSENLVTIITGGDAQFLSINLKNGIFANSNFLLEGLNYILEFNYNK